MPISNPIFVALDLDDLAKVMALAEKVQPYVGGFKVGPRLSLRYGAKLVKELAPLGPVFLDNKYFDIPNTMEAAVKSAFEIGATYVTVHAQSGKEALRKLALLEADCRKERDFHLLAVTILTSFDQAGLPEVSQKMPIEQQVESLALLTQESGLNGIVCSAEELPRIRGRFPKLKLVVPGIRLGENASNDQKRIADPKSAILSGASHLVVGRPIVDAKDPVEAAKKFHDAVESARG